MSRSYPPPPTKFGPSNVQAKPATPKGSHWPNLPPPTQFGVASVQQRAEASVHAGAPRSHQRRAIAAPATHWPVTALGTAQGRGDPGSRPRAITAPTSSKPAEQVLQMMQHNRQQSNWSQPVPPPPQRAPSPSLQYPSGYSPTPPYGGLPNYPPPWHQSPAVPMQPPATIPSPRTTTTTTSLPSQQDTVYPPELHKGGGPTEKRSETKGEERSAPYRKRQRKRGATTPKDKEGTADAEEKGAAISAKLLALLPGEMFEGTSHSTEEHLFDNKEAAIARFVTKSNNKKTGIYRNSLNEAVKEKIYKGVVGIIFRRKKKEILELYDGRKTPVIAKPEREIITLDKSDGVRGILFPIEGPPQPDILIMGVKVDFIEIGVDFAYAKIHWVPLDRV